MINPIDLENPENLPKSFLEEFANGRGDDDTDENEEVIQNA